MLRFRSRLGGLGRKRVSGICISIWRLLMFAVLSCSILPLRAQNITTNQEPQFGHLQWSLVQDQSTSATGALDYRFTLMPAGPQSYISLRPRFDAFFFERPIWTSSPGTIQRMESAFYCNDTPFVDQVRLPLATFWGGRVKLVGFESDVTTANFVMGLPGQGALHNLSAFGGNGFLAVHTPPSDQLAGIHMTFSWLGGEA